MACNITRPTPQVLFDRHRDTFQSTVMGGANIVPESNEWYVVSVNYAASEEFYAIADQMEKDRDPSTACAASLEQMAADDGVYPLPAIPAQGYLKLSGTAGAVLPVPLEFTVGGIEFITASNANQPSAIGADGAAVVRVRAVTPGAAGNLTATTGTLDTVAAGVDTDVEVCGGTFCQGSDAETTEVFRQRYIERRKYRPRAQMQWIQEKLEEWPCATRAVLRQGSCCGCGCENTRTVGIYADDHCEDCGCVDCGGKMHFYLMFDNSFKHGQAPDNVLSEAESWMFGSPQGFGLGQAPVGICGKISSFTAVEVNTFVDIADCPTGTDLVNVQNVVDEFFTTVEPSVPVQTNELAATVSRLLGGVDVNVRFELVDSSVGYGNGVPNEESRHVYVTPCALEPDCDYMIVNASTTITSASSAQTGCPS